MIKEKINRCFQSLTRPPQPFHKDDKIYIKSDNDLVPAKVTHVKYKEDCKCWIVYGFLDPSVDLDKCHIPLNFGISASCCYHNKDEGIDSFIS